MCTIALAWQAFADAPLVVAANRDELLDRPAEPPRVDGEDPRVLAPRDAEAGGTWLGVNEAGVLVALTNRWVDREGERSRGLLVADALRERSAEDAARFVERSVDAAEYAGFNLVVADADAAHYFEYDGRLAHRPFAPGVHVVVNVGADGRFVVPEGRAEAGEQQAENARRLSAALQPAPGETGAEWRERAADAVADHDYGVCVHRETFGTRSSSLVTVRADGSVDYAFADGPPCTTPFDPVESQL
jgi:uncharacterized protein with NRDE domain